MNLNQQEAARRIGIHWKQLGRIELGQSKPSNDTAIAIRRALGVDVTSDKPGVTEAAARTYTPRTAVTVLTETGQGEGAEGDATTDGWERRNPYAGFVEVRVVAEVAAGEPLEYLPEDETILFPADGAPDEAKGEVLVRARGDSMTKFDIENGDYLVVEMRQGGVAAIDEIVIVHSSGGLVVERWGDGATRGNPELFAIVRWIWTKRRPGRRS